MTRTRPRAGIALPSLGVALVGGQPGEGAADVEVTGDERAVGERRPSVDPQADEVVTEEAEEVASKLFGRSRGCGRKDADRKAG